MSKTSDSNAQLDVINIQLRLRNDGGPIFRHLASLADPHVRGDRVRQLLYLGLLREKEVLREAQDPVEPLSDVPQGSVRQVKAKAKGLPVVAAKRIENESARAIHPEDLGAIFDAA